MTLFALASAWYLALVALVMAAVRSGRHRRKAAEAATFDETYEARRRCERGEHLAQVREEELAQMRRAAARRRFSLRAGT